MTGVFQTGLTIRTNMPFEPVVSGQLQEDIGKFEVILDDQYGFFPHHKIISTRLIRGQCGGVGFRVAANICLTGHITRGGIHGFRRTFRQIQHKRGAGAFPVTVKADLTAQQAGKFA